MKQALASQYCLKPCQSDFKASERGYRFHLSLCGFPMLPQTTSKRASLGYLDLEFLATSVSTVHAPNLTVSFISTQELTMAHTTSECMVLRFPPLFRHRSVQTLHRVFIYYVCCSSYLLQHLLSHSVTHTHTHSKIDGRIGGKKPYL